MPMIAATPCQEHATASRCCAADCPMMAKLAAAASQPHSRIDSSQCGCQVDPYAPVSKADNQRPGEPAEALLVESTSAPLLTQVGFRIELDRIPPNPIPDGHSRSSLCSFQI